MTRQKVQHAQQPEPIAIVGSGCRFPGGANSASSLWKLLESPRDLCVEIPADRFDTKAFYHPVGTHHGTTNVRQSYLLDEDVRVFDAAFFNISPNEADSMDPQQRLLLETVYEALEAGGHTIESLNGSDTAVFAGTMNVDLNDTLLRDLNTVPTYFATGTNRAIISNRVSYFFNWHGPSMTIDTACSSSLIAVHQGVKALRTGETRLAVACGTNVILNPEMYIIESKLGMLSPTGRSRMWDADADGYARGEGVAAVVLKRLSDAIADGDRIECIIRETGANQDGFSNGITVPNTDAQAALIRQTYARAGLDLENNPSDRPQFFEAHGTGTKAGDPKEAAAIYQCFGQHASPSDPMYVGSIKTIIGHLEGAAGLAGLLKASAMIQKGYVSPNRLFNRLNPDIEPFYKGLHVPMELTPWPKLAEGVPRRVSVNSFGFGGSNAHAILEQYRGGDDDAGAAIKTGDDSGDSPSFPAVTPFVFSAGSESSLVAQLQAYSDHLKAFPDIAASDLAWTLQSRRSQFSIKAAFSALTIEQLTSKIDAKLAALTQSPGTTLGTRSVSLSKAEKGAKPRILGVFTGQGAQWPAMGAHLIRSNSSDLVQKVLQDLEDSLNTLPASDRPQWRLRDEMLAGDDVSRISEAALSQPLCTAIQIVLVELLRAAGITFAAVVGHSSGEIAAAYAAGFLSARDAVRVAYYRGLYAKMAGNEETGQKGAMLAVGTSWEDAQDLVNLRAFKGRLAVAAHNSSASVTLSGDADAIAHAKRVFDEEKKFARFLKVDTAYHSHHMLPCGDSYVKALRACGVKVRNPTTTGRDVECSWFSSVTGSDKAVVPTEQLQDLYWLDNMTNAVLFADAVRNAVSSVGDQLSLAIEVGPHPALKGPAMQNISDVRPTVPLPYCGVLGRGKNDIEMFAEALGFVWTHLSARGVDIESYRKVMTGESGRQPMLVHGLPSYRWDHGRTHWSESRISRRIRGKKHQSPHELLGFLSPDSNARDMRWTNVLKVSEIPWMDGHQLQSQTVFPAAGYVAMALEASRKLAQNLAADKTVELFELLDLNIPRAITFEDGDNKGVETIVTLTGAQHHPGDNFATAEFSCYSLPVSSMGSEQELDLAASGSVKVVFGTPDPWALSCAQPHDYSMTEVNTDRFYAALSKLGYGYSGPFRAMSSMKRKLNQSSAMVDTYPYNVDDIDPEDPSAVYLVHPSVLDVAFQSSMLAYSAPGDDRLWSLHVPTSIRRIRINPEVCASLSTSGWSGDTKAQVPVCAVLIDSDPDGDGDSGRECFSASIDVFGEDGEQGMVQVEGLTIKPFAPATEADDRRLFTYIQFDHGAPNGPAVVKDVRPSPAEAELAVVCERISYYYLRKWKAELTDEEWENPGEDGQQKHHAFLRNWVDHTLATASNGQRTTLKREWAEDSREDILALIDRYSDKIDVKLLWAVGENIPATVRGETTILEHMLKDNMLYDFYKQGLGFQRYNEFLAGMMKPIIHRYPHANILEIGAGTGGATMAVLEGIGGTMSSYTYTDVSVGFFGKAAEIFKAYSDRMTFKVLDIEKSPESQGYEAGAYDIIVASNVLHATASLQTTLENTRKLLKPGGYLMLLEITGDGPIRVGTIVGGLSGWWLGIPDGRVWAPTVSPGEWHSVLRKSGFGGVDAITPEIDGLAWPLSIIASQAVDDRVRFLRRPLLSPSSSSSSSLASIFIEDLVILGTGTLESSRIAEEVAEHVSRFCGQTTILNGLPTEAEAQALNPMSTFLNLADLDSPIFKDVTDEKMDGLHRMLDLARHVLWITKGAQVEQPYHMASIAFSRALAQETAHINFNHLDLSVQQHGDVSKFIAEYLLQCCALDEWEEAQKHGQQQQQNYQPILWSREPEALLDRGLLKVPRLVSNVDQNARLNSSRRAITKRVPISTSAVSISHSSDGSPPFLEAVKSDNKKKESVAAPFRVESSSLMALHVAGDTFLFLAIGRDTKTGRHVAFLTGTNTSEAIPLAATALGDDVDIDALLIATASELLAESLLQSLSSGSSVLVHCSSKDRFLAAALSRRAAASGKGIRLTFTCDAETEVEDAAWIRLNIRSTQHVLREKLRLARASHFLDLTSSTLPSELSLRIAQALPSGHRRISASALLQGQSSLPEPSPSHELEEALAGRLRDAVAAARLSLGKAAAGEAQGRLNLDDLIIPLERVREPSKSHQATVAVQWPQDGFVEVDVRPLNAQGMFAQDKTYVLFGLSGMIGQSLTEWMVSNGAGCVCITSRRPKIDERWLDSFRETTNATVKVFSMDVTDRKSVKATVDEIRATCPPIAGIANGAMVLNDCPFSTMSTEAMRNVLGPKIDGTNYLDEMFNENAPEELDFFVLFSSSAGVVGNSGQANYSAANGYINSFARSRRRRGLAGSTFDIGRVVGIGYVENVGEGVAAQLTKFGLMPVSEPDLRQAFGETIRHGYPRPSDHDHPHGIPDAAVTTGIRTIRDDEEIQGPWFHNPIFSHCIIDSKRTGPGAGSEDQGGKKAALPVGRQLAGATTMEQALEIIQDCFSAKLRVMLQMSDQQSIDQDAPLVELGIDSLVAVEVRSWFLKELKVDIPVLKIVGGASLTEVCERALEKLPEGLLAGIGGQGQGPDSGKSGQSAEPVAKAKPVAAPSQPAPQTQPALPQWQAQDRGADSGAASSTSSPEDDGSTAPPDTPGSLGASEIMSPGIPVGKWRAASAVSTPPSTRPGSVQGLGIDIKTTSAAAPPRRFTKSVPISLGQSRFWFLRLLLEDQNTSNVTINYHISGSLRIADLERAVRIATARHEALRTCFIEDDRGDAYQKVLASSTIRLERKKIESADEVAPEFAKLISHNFDLASGELLRLVLLTLSPTSHYLIISYHHIVMDGVSLQVLLSDLEKAYTGKALGPAPRQYTDFSVVQQRSLEKGEMSDELAFWRGVFPAGEQPPVLPLLPIARTSSRIVMKNYDTQQVLHRLSPELVSRIKTVSRAQRSTPFHFYLAAFNTMLFRFTGVDDLTIGIADAARNDSDVMGSIGFFLNLLTLRFRRDASKPRPFSEALEESRKTTHAALANSRLPFDVLLTELEVARSSTHSPFFQAFLDYRQGAQESQPFGNCQLQGLEANTGRTAYDITLDVTDNPNDSIVIFRTQKSLYDMTATNLLMETYVHLLDVLSARPSLTLDETPLFGKEQLARAVEVGRGPLLISDWPATLPHRIDQVAQEKGNQDKAALVDGSTGKTLTYSGMMDRIEAIAEALQKKMVAGVGAGPQPRVLVFQQAAVDWACSMLAIMRIGAIYVPLDLRNPLPRLAAVAKDCQPSAVLADATTLERVPQLLANFSNGGDQTPVVINVSGVGSKASTRIPNLAQADSPAAILYTSGSTGTPKGITVTHSGLRNEIEGYTKTWKLGAERVLQQSSFTFNHSSDQMYTGLVNGGTVIVVPDDKRGDPIEVTKLVREHSVTYTKATPSEYSLWMQYGGDNLGQCSAWRFAFGGGEPLTTSVTQEFADLGLPGLRVFNSYGPTEISISSTKIEVPYRQRAYLEDMYGAGRIPCGYSLPNYNTYVVDEQLRPLPVGMPGEVCIGGAGVSLGYLNNRGLTDESFVPNPFATEGDVARGWGAKMYRTGDVGHLREDGAMVFHSRMAGDSQVKIRGLRIELSDIESNIVSCSGGVLREAVVTLRGGGAAEEGGSEFLVAHVVFAPHHDQLTEQERESFLERLLMDLPIPQYMIPVAAIPLNRLPLTNHSKVDRKAMSSMPLPERAFRAVGNGTTASGSGEGGDDSDAAEPMTETMVQLKRVWRSVLGKASERLGLDIGPRTSFFLVGGNSLLVIRLQAQIRKTFNVVIRIVDLLGANTLGEMARRIEEGAGVELIDWEKETALPEVGTSPAEESYFPAVSGGPRTVLVTGATGFLAKYILPHLVASPDVAKVHCVAIRDKEQQEGTSRLPSSISSSPKVVAYRGDLSQPRLGLSESDFSALSREADVILHMGAVRSFWDNYHVLRPSNVEPTRELVRLAARRRVPIHYISTVGVLPGPGPVAPSSASANPPPRDGSNGYVATRWASERILERAAAGLGVPSRVYRFLPSSSLSGGSGGAAVEDEFVRFVDASGLVPDPKGWSGRIDLVPAEEAARWLCDSVLLPPGAADGGAAAAATTTQFSHYESPVAVDVTALSAHIERLRGGRAELGRMPALKWVGRIKALGFGYLLASQEMAVEGGGQDRQGEVGAKFVYRR